MTRAVVVGSGPNGLAAATVLAEAGAQVTVVEADERLGGGARASDPLLPGLIQDHCAAIHPVAASSPFLAGRHLESRGVRWLRAEIDCAHPLDGGDAVLLRQSIERTAADLGADGARWQRLFGSSSRGFDELAEDIFQPLLRLPRHPLRLARFGAIAAQPPTLLARAFREPRTRALFAGVAAHAFHRLDVPLVTGIGAGIIAAGHSRGWPVVAGGTGVLVDALVSHLRALGVVFETGRRIRRRSELPENDIAIFDVHPHDLADILGDDLPTSIAAAYRRFRVGPGAFKLELAVEGEIPWTNEQITGAGTVHLGGSAREIVASEALVTRGGMPERPFVLVGQQFVADPARSSRGINPVYAYAHVPTGFTGDATETILRQFERFAPGMRERIVAMRAVSPADMASGNANFVGGDILTGAKSPLQFTLGPRLTRHPYDTGVKGVYLCSAATPPGPGVHGMSGANAATRALALHSRSR